MEDGREVAPGGFQEEMVVVRHQTETMNAGPVPFGSRIQVAQKPLIILLGPKDGPPLIAPGGDVIEGTWIFNSERPSHREKISKGEGFVKSVDLTHFLHDRRHLDIQFYYEGEASCASSADSPEPE